ncbi:DUF1501 domain-containing protein [Roseiconus nitratireducens]|uniref:DUF1501 domain-containing protein n=1 Tax=Roseiconus nitratireducens TaxID=2605748 RepID=A0A5M6CYJ3_9BACT|nr:DUF1501 domain-containing protein [Roseiconus nitratireducens]KAA5537955.1 DUF1501 domain-containing protein [Roseiconus nitratireducens]
MHFLNRRQFTAAGIGAGAIALQSLLAGETAARDGASAAPHHPPTARSVIFLFMSGGPSQVDTFDPKPELSRLEGKDVPDSIVARVPRIKRAGLKNLMASPWEFHSHGESGLAVSTLFPEVAKHVDDLCVVRSMTHRNPVHGPGECVALTGTGTGDRPSLGAWCLYGLGSMHEQLPAFLTMNLHTDGMQHPQAAGWGTGFLPSRFQGTVVDPAKGISHVTMPEGTTSTRRKSELDLIRQFDQRFVERIGGNGELEARIRSYQMAFEMQTAAPELFDIASETADVQKQYGMDDAATKLVGRGCLMARRMVQRGVRFVQLRIGGWDAHGNIKGNHEKMAARTDRPIAALLNDLKQHHLLDSTLVVWGGEFGRTPTMEGLGKGRDHSPAAYTMWLAGGGVRGGQTIGETDELGYTVTERPVSPQDLHATILHALGIDSTRLVYDHHGLQETPLGVSDGAPVMEVFG